MTTEELTNLLERMRNIMVDVSMGGRRIQEINPEYKTLYQAVDTELHDRGINNPIQYPDLWDWYGRWSSGDLPSYQSRRTFLSDIFHPLITNIRRISRGEISTPVEPTGWPRVDRTIGEIRKQLALANNEEQYQAIGLLCREALISLAQAVYDPERHPSLDEVTPSDTDAKRMLTAYIAVELAGGSNEEARKHAKAAVDFAHALQHRRTANFRQAAMCLEATTAVVNIIAIVSGQRDP